LPSLFFHASQIWLWPSGRRSSRQAHRPRAPAQAGTCMKLYETELRCRPDTGRPAPHPNECLSRAGRPAQASVGFGTGQGQAHALHPDLRCNCPRVPSPAFPRPSRHNRPHQNHSGRPAVQARPRSTPLHSRRPSRTLYAYTPIRIVYECIFRDSPKTKSSGRPADDQTRNSKGPTCGPSGRHKLEKN
jgi:hypothetical protein